MSRFLIPCSCKLQSPLCFFSFPLLRTLCTLRADRLDGDQFRMVVAHCNYKLTSIYSPVYRKLCEYLPFIFFVSFFQVFFWNILPVGLLFFLVFFISFLASHSQSPCLAPSLSRVTLLKGFLSFHNEESWINAVNNAHQLYYRQAFFPPP